MSLVRDIVDAFLFPNRDPHAIPVLDGPLSPNHALDQAAALPFDVPGADDAVTGSDGALYVSAGAQVWRLGDDARVWATLDGPAGALAAVPGDGLLVAVSGVGIVRLDADGREAARLTEAGGVRLHCVTALTVAGESLFIAHGSRHQPADRWRHDLMACRPPSGSLLVGDVALGGGKLLADRLAWPAGLALDRDGRRLWFTEAWAHTLRVLRLDASTSATVLPNLPGYPARLRSDARGQLWTSMFALRTQLVEFVLRENAYRTAMIERVPPELWVCPALRADLDYREVLQYGSVKKLGIQKAWSPPRAYGLVARLSDAGEIRQSWHSRVDGHCHGVTSVVPLADGALLAVSKGHGKLVRIAVDATEGGSR